jgi:acetyl esterase/lipase
VIDTGAEARAARRRGEHRPQPIPVSELAEDRIAAGVPVRVLTPPAIRGVHLHLHGGGFVYGSSRLQDDMLDRLARRCRVAVVSVEYRLAPEDPYPAGPDDCETAALWLVENVKAEFGCDCVSIGGESAGANLAVVTLLRLRDRHDFTGFQAAGLVKGIYDLTLSQLRDARDPELTRGDLEALVEQYMGARDRADPDGSPIYADLHSLPPALFAVGAVDVLLNDSRVLAKRWRAAGNHAQLDVFPDAGHELDPGDSLQAFLSSQLDA